MFIIFLSINVLDFKYTTNIRNKYLGINNSPKRKSIKKVVYKLTMFMWVYK